MGRAFVIAIRIAVLLAYTSSLCNFTLGGLEITSLSAPGLFLTFVFIVQLFLNFLLFEEIPLTHRRIPLNTTDSAFADNS